MGSLRGGGGGASGGWERCLGKIQRTRENRGCQACDRHERAITGKHGT